MLTSLPDKNAFLRSLRHMRLQSYTISALSIAAASGVVYVTTPEQIGSFAFYSLVLLLLLNAALAQLNVYRVVRPVTRLLNQLESVSHKLTEGEVPVLDPGKLPKNPAFANLEASLLDVLDRLSTRVRKAEIARDDATACLMKGSPFTMFKVSRKGCVNAILKDPFAIAPLLGLKVNCEPSTAAWGAKNASAYREKIEQAFAEPVQHWFDLIFPAKASQEERHLRGLAVAINPCEVLVVIGDLTAIDRKVAGENEIVAACENERRNASLRKFASTVLDDFRQVSAALGRFAALGRNSADPALVREADLAESTIRHGEDLAATLAALAGETRYNFACAAPNDLKALVENPSLRALAPANVQLVVNVSNEPLPAVDLDAVQMLKALANLVSNAVEAIASRPGRIWLSLEPSVLSDDAARGFRHTSAFRPGKGVLITLVDDGAGMADDLLERAFDPLVSVKGGGHGFGLPSVLAIVNAHAGAISVKSSPGYGTTVYVFLPASRMTDDEIRLVREIAPNGEILLVDDDPTILHTTRLVLKALKVAAHPAATESEALAKLRALRTRLKAVFVDASINCASSAPLVRKIRAEAPSLKIVVVSGAPEESVARQFVEVGGYDAFLSKPYTASDIAGALDLAT